MTLKYQGNLCECGQVETGEPVLFECNRYGQERERWRGTVERLKYVMCVYGVTIVYDVDSDELEKETMRYLIVLWNSREM